MKLTPKALLPTGFRFSVGPLQTTTRPAWRLFQPPTGPRPPVSL